MYSATFYYTFIYAINQAISIVFAKYIFIGAIGFLNTKKAPEGFFFRTHRNGTLVPYCELEQVVLHPR